MVSNKQILDKFINEYDFIYNANMQGQEVAGADDAMNYFDNAMKSNPKFKDKILSLAKDRNDIFSSDRECSAIVFALDSLGVLDELEQ